MEIMTTEIRHRRLYAFFNSRVLSALMWVTITCLLMADGEFAMGWLLPLVASGVAMLLFIGYSLWFWIKKPTKVVIDTWFSDAVSLLTLYFMAVAAFRVTDIWWFIPAIAVAVVILFVAMVRGREKVFEI